MLKFFGSLASQKPVEAGDEKETYTRFENAKVLTQQRSKYTRMSVAQTPKLRAVTCVEEPRKYEQAAIPHVPDRVEPQVLEFNDTAHLYAGDTPSIDVLRRALPNRFIDAASND